PKTELRGQAPTLASGAGKQKSGSDPDFGVAGLCRLPVPHRAPDDGVEVARAHAAGRVRQEARLLERSVDERAGVPLNVADRRETVRDADVTHQRDERPWQGL